MQSVAWGNHSHPSNPYYSRKSVLKIIKIKREQTFVLFRLVYILKQVKNQIQTAIQNSCNKVTHSDELIKVQSDNKKICVLHPRPPLNVKLRNFTLKFAVACENISFSSLFAAGDVSRGETSATQRQKFHTDDVKSVRNPVRSADWSTE